jgi:formylglycine-generating enzyme required for sulfatase activity
MQEAAVRPETIVVPAGAFQMGDDAGRPDERPAHDVYVSAFEMAVLPVTNDEYARFLAATGHDEPRFWHDPLFSRPRQPVVGVSWRAAVAYCTWIADATGEPWRLPSEAEREKAARGGIAGADYPAGETDLRFEQEATFDVGRSRPNGYGLYDMAYNVHEWCSDWYDPAYYAASPARDPQGPATGTRRASRGGAWRHHVKLNRCAARSSLPPSFEYNDYGFRIAKSV